MQKAVSFHQMKDGTREDYEFLDAEADEYARGLPDVILNSLRQLGVGLQGYRVSRLEHSLQCATRARRDGADDEMVIAALLHDIGDELAPYNHAAVAAAVLRPYVREEVSWIVAQHGLMQTYYYGHHQGRDRNMRDQLRGHRWFEAAAAFCENWDQASFDPDYPSLTLADFEPLVHEIFTRKPHDPMRLLASSPE
jgi:predicted HD phosphohydrolase